MFELSRNCLTFYNLSIWCANWG